MNFRQYFNVPDPIGDIAVRAFSACSEGALVVLDTDPTHVLGGPVPGQTFLENAYFGIRLPTVDEVIAGGAMGWLPSAIPAGATGLCRTRGIVPVLASGTINATEFVGISSTVNRLARAQAASSGEFAIGVAMSSGDDGDYVFVRLFGATVPIP